MSKFSITKYEGHERLELFYSRADGCSFDMQIDPCDLADLASACQAALCQNSGVMSKPTCACDPSAMSACNDPEYVVRLMDAICIKCDHRKSCHQAPGGEA